MHPSRRRFLARAVLGAGAFAGLRLLGACSPVDPVLPDSRRFGPLHADPDGILDLPVGFSYRVLSRAGDTMNDGHRVPAAPDDMGAFATDEGLTVIVRNHEIDHDWPRSSGPFRGSPGPDTLALAWDAGADGRPCLGGTTTLVYDTRERRLVSQHLSLVGTLRNCSGGTTPWGSWISCEESAASAGGALARDHGYAFEVRASAAPGLQLAEPLAAMGRFKRESIVVDPASGVVYQTEDLDDGLLYRFLPDVPGDLARGGRLQALAIAGRPDAEIRNRDRARVALGERLETRWIDLESPDTEANDLRLRGRAAGAVRFARNEGACFENGALWLCSTEGARSGNGQLWRYRAAAAADGAHSEGGALELFFESRPGRAVEHLDTIVPAPWGDLLVTEDGAGRQHLAGVTPEGELYAFARNALSDSEMTGPTFSPDGTTLFLGIQKDALTLAIDGPWSGA